MLLDYVVESIVAPSLVIHKGTMLCGCIRCSGTKLLKPCKILILRCDQLCLHRIGH